MKTMETQALTRRNLETALIEQCWKDPEFKKAAVSDPKGMFERHTGRMLPPQVRSSFMKRTPTLCISQFRRPLQTSANYLTQTWKG